MLKVVSVDTMRKIEAAADASGLRYDMMMQNAGRAVALRVMSLVAQQADTRVTVLVGPGNNGGDGLVAGAIIARESAAQVRFYLLKPRPDDDLNFKAVHDAGLFVAMAQDDRDARVLRNMVASADVVVDALFGIGVKLPFRSDVAKVLRNAQQALHDDQQPAQPEIVVINPAIPAPVQRRSPVVVAVDCPSGLECDTGELDNHTIFADETVTFIAAKPGLFEFPGAAAVGKLHVSPISVPADLPELDSEKYFVADAAYVNELLPVRPANSNKGTFGKALIVAGSTNFIGAAGLSSLAAYRVGTGLVTVGSAGPVIASLSARFLEPTWLLLPHDMGALSESAAPLIHQEASGYNALLLGPGWGKENTTRELLVKLLESRDTLVKASSRSIGFLSSGAQPTPEEAAEENKLPPVVIDADGLNLLSEIERWWTLLPERTVITPHPGEMARLAKLETAELLRNRRQIAAEKAVEWNVVVVLKGAHTLIAEPDGRMAVLPFKTDALATAGTGDVLAGMITGLLAQGLKPFEAAVVGGYLHGLAGEQAASKQGNSRSVIAGDVLEAIGQAIRVLTKG
jgi:ADP-dependent NAD(P)H-hydrate dehydratase / NAD(P)H-hydrate epimerase